MIKPTRPKTPFHTLIASQLKAARYDRDGVAHTPFDNTESELRARLQTGADVVLPTLDRLIPPLRLGGLEATLGASSDTGEVSVRLHEPGRDPQYKLAFVQPPHADAWEALLVVIAGGRVVETRRLELPSPLTGEVVQATVEQIALQLVRSNVDPWHVQ